MSFEQSFSQCVLCICNFALLEEICFTSIPDTLFFFSFSLLHSLLFIGNLNY